MGRCLLRCHVEASDLGRVGPRPPRKPSIRSDVRVIIDAVSGFSSVSCLETWRVPVPRIRDRLHRIEPSLSEQPPRGQTVRIEPRSPDGSPKRDTRFPQREVVQGSSLALLKSASEVGTPQYRVRGRFWARCVLRFVLSALVGLRPALRAVSHVCGTATE